MRTVFRATQVAEVRRRLRDAPIVALLGARQVGKTTLARQIASRSGGPTTIFDLEDPRDVARLADPLLALGDCRGLVVLDEIHRVPDLFPVLRVLADRRPLPARFLVLGSASPDLLRQGAESLAGRIAFHHLTPFDLREVGTEHLERLWRRGGFPRAYLARSELSSTDWRRDFIATFLERDLPQLGITIPAATLRRFWEMLSHIHGQVLNSSELARAFGVADTTIRRYLETLEATYVVRTLRPYHANIVKRQVKAPKVYIADSGLLHQLLGIDTQHALERHPKVGASWEGFMISTVMAHLGARPEDCYFWATHGGAELDLVVVKGRQRRGFEFKRTTIPRVTPSIRAALHDLGLKRVDVVHAGHDTFPLQKGVRAVAAARVLEDLE